MGRYHVAEICLNGHITSGSVDSHPDRSQKQCIKCGVETITECPSCRKLIRGDFESGMGVATLSQRGIPGFCQECGEPYPWTLSKLEAARELVEELGLNIPDKTLLTESIEELVRDTPKAQAAAVRFQRLTERAKPVVKEGFKTLLVEVVSQAVKKTLGW